MDLNFFKYIAILLVFATSATGNSTITSDLEKSLLKRILLENKFNAYIRPKWTNETQSSVKPTTVKVSLYILNLAVDTENQECSIQMYFRQEWNDFRLAYEEKVTDEVKYLPLQDPVGIWLPDLFFVNEKSGQLHLLTKPNSFLNVYPNGDVRFSQKLSVMLSAPMDLRKYPFDSQTCNLEIESYGYNTNDLTIKWKLSPPPFGPDKIPNFYIQYSPTEAISKLNDVSFKRLTLKINLLRIPFAQLLHVYLFLFFLVLISWISFWLNPSHQLLRISFSFLLVLISTLFLQSKSEFFYSQEYLTALDVWSGTSFIFIFMAMLESVYVLASKKISSTDLKNEVVNQKNNPEIQKPEKEESKVIEIFSNKLSFRNSHADFICAIAFPCGFFLFNIVYFTFLLV